MQKPLSYEEMHLRKSEDNCTDVPHTFAKINTDGDCSSTRGFPSVQVDSESSKENQSEVLLFLYIKMLIRIYPETFENKWTDGCKLTLSLLDT